MEEDADAAEAPFVLGVEVAELLFVEVLRVLVEIGQAAVDHVLDELLPVVVRQLADIVLVDLGEHLDNLPDQPVVPVRRGRAVADRQPQPDERRDRQQPQQVSQRHINLA